MQVFLSNKNVSTSTVKRRLCEAGLHGRITVSSGPRCTKTGQKNCGIKSFRLMNQSLKSIGQIGGSTCGERLVKECNPLISHQP